MERYQVILAYDGTRFCGFQRQAGKSEALTVQSVLETALREMGWQGKSVLVAGRTDTGVHAAGQVIAFDMDWKHSQEDLIRALNAHLPLDIASRKAKVVAPNHHPRYAAVARHYRYRLLCEETRDPLHERYAWRVWPRLTIEPMQHAAQQLLGTHDFQAFGTPPTLGGSTTRTLMQAFWHIDGSEQVFEVIGNAFLYHMVRRIVALLVKIGKGEEEPDIVSYYLEGGNPSSLKTLAPPHGLTLSEVIYPPENSGESKNID